MATANGVVQSVYCPLTHAQRLAALPCMYSAHEDPSSEVSCSAELQKSSLTIVTYRIPCRTGATPNKCPQHIAGSPAGGSLLKYKGDGFPKLGGRANKKICAGPMTPAAIAESHTEATAFMAPAAQRAEVDSQGSSQGGSEEGNREHAWGSNVNGGGSGGNRFGVEGARSSASRKRRSSGGPGQR